jgi:hypothetical protein
MQTAFLLESFLQRGNGQLAFLGCQRSCGSDAELTGAIASDAEVIMENCRKIRPEPRFRTSTDKRCKGMVRNAPFFQH